MTEVEYINSELAKYGKVSFTDLPRWRIVWSDDQYELRNGPFNEFSAGIFIRTTTGVQRVPKYSYLKSRWILERFIPGDQGGYHPDIPESRRGSYEPIFPFEDGDGNALPLNLKAAQFMVEAAESPATKFSEAELIEQLKKKEALEVEEILQALGE